jgi:hypothetical protein
MNIATITGRRFSLSQMFDNVRFSNAENVGKLDRVLNRVLSASKTTPIAAGIPPTVFVAQMTFDDIPLAAIAAQENAGGIS